MSESTETSAQPTPSEAPSLADWAAGDDPAPPQRPEPENAAVEGDDTPDPAPKTEAAADDPLADDDEIAPAEEDGEEPPEFWSAERKAEWQKLKDFPELRAAIKGHYEDATRGLNKKLEEAATARKQAEESIKKYQADQEQMATWWQANGQQFTQAFVDRWQGVDWVKLWQDNPAEAGRLQAIRDHEAGMLQQAAGQAKQAAEQAQVRRQAEEQEARRSEHAKLATKFPKAFSNPEVAQKTYNTLAQYALSKGIPPERISQTFEAPIVEILMEGYKYQQLRAKAKEVTTPKQDAQPASKTPKRVVPGASQREANQEDGATRQALERLKSGERLTPDEAALAFR